MHALPEECLHLRFRHRGAVTDPMLVRDLGVGIHSCEIFESATEPRTGRGAVCGVVVGQLLPVLAFAVSGGNLTCQVLVAIARVQHVEGHHMATLAASGGTERAPHPQSLKFSKRCV